MKKILLVAGARPNFMKIAPLMEEMNRAPSLHPLLVHTGQHYDQKMSKLFFEDLDIPKPDINLEVGSGTHAIQTAAIIQRFEPVLLKEKPDLVVVVGDVNSTIACALTSVKLGIPVAHVEAGLRSWDRTMPEEINRILTDAISDFLFTTEENANQNLIREGISPEKIHFVGNLMIDTLMKHQGAAQESDVLLRFGLKPRMYGLVTLHRPSNVDSEETLDTILDALQVVAQEIPLFFPCHPRTQKKLAYLPHHKANFQGIGPEASLTGLQICEPLGYLDFLRLMTDAKVVLTDSGGIQEETTILGTPCLTLRNNTERPVTISHGTNVIVGTNKDSIIAEGMKVIAGIHASQSRPPLWDGQAAERIVKVIREGL